MKPALSVLVNLTDGALVTSTHATQGLVWISPIQVLVSF